MSKTTDAYWKANLRLLAVVLVLWFTISYLCGIFFAPELNRFKLFGTPLGFWFAQQGSIYGFVLLIFFYSWRMGQLDRKFGVQD